MKIGYFITARLKSSRLKQKILLDLNGSNVLDNVIERCKKVHGADEVVLCTSTNSQDSALYDYALKHNIKFYAGSEDDVLQRLLDAAKYYSIDSFLSITADNPLHSYYLGDIIIDQAKEDNPDFIFTHGVPLGIAPYYINTKALEVACYMKRDSNTEIWGPFVNRPDFFSVGNICVENSLFDGKYRITCDYPEDYKFIRKIHSNFKYNRLPDIFEVFEVLESNKGLLEINKNISQSMPSKVELDNIARNFTAMKEKGHNFSESIGKVLMPRNIEISINI